MCVVFPAPQGVRDRGVLDAPRPGPAERLKAFDPPPYLGLGPLPPRAGERRPKTGVVKTGADTYPRPRYPAPAGGREEGPTGDGRKLVKGKPHY